MTPVRSPRPCPWSDAPPGDSKTNAGWTVGWGSEFGLTQNVSAHAETMYFNLGTERRNMAGILADVQRDGFISTVGLRFRFGG